VVLVRSGVILGFWTCSAGWLRWGSWREGSLLCGEWCIASWPLFCRAQARSLLQTSNEDEVPLRLRPLVPPRRRRLCDLHVQHVHAHRPNRHIVVTYGTSIVLSRAASFCGSVSTSMGLRLIQWSVLARD
jgi:hypothetical protein